MTEARHQIETVLCSTDFRGRLLQTARLDVGNDGAEELAQQLSFEALRAAAKVDRLNSPEAFLWACYKRCKRDAIRKAE